MTKSRGLYRSVQTAKWKDAWHADLSLSAKVLFDYCITNDRQTPCGVFEASLRQISFETGIPIADLDSIMAELYPKVVYWPEHNIAFVRNFYRYNKSGPGFVEGAINYLHDFPTTVQEFVVAIYPELNGNMGGLTPVQPLSHGGQ